MLFVHSVFTTVVLPLCVSIIACPTNYFLFYQMNYISNQPTPTVAQFGIGRKNKGGATFEELNKMAAEKLAVEKKIGGGGGGGLDMIDSLKGMDLGALMNELDPSMLQELLAEGMNDPALQEMVRFIPSSALHRACHQLDFYSAILFLINSYTFHLSSINCQSILLHFHTKHLNK